MKHLPGIEFGQIYRLLVLSDLVAVASNGVRYLIETKGREDIDIANKERAVILWCENATRLMGTQWRYTRVPQKNLRIYNRPNSRTFSFPLRSCCFEFTGQTKRVRSVVTSPGCFLCRNVRFVVSPMLYCQRAQTAVFALDQKGGFERRIDIKRSFKKAQNVPVCSICSNHAGTGAATRAVGVAVRGIALEGSTARIAARSRVGSIRQLRIWGIHPTEANVRIGHAGRTDGLSFQMSYTMG